MEELIDIETQGWNALAEGTGVDFYQRVMAEDGVMLLPGVGRMGKAEALEGLRQALPWSWFEMTEPQVVPLTNDAAAVAYTVTAQRDGQPIYQALMSSTYVYRDGRWTLLIHQQTPNPMQSQ